MEKRKTDTTGNEKKSFTSHPLTWSRVFHSADYSLSHDAMFPALPARLSVSLPHVVPSPMPSLSVALGKVINHNRHYWFLFVCLFFSSLFTFDILWLLLHWSYLNFLSNFSQHHLLVLWVSLSTLFSLISSFSWHALSQSHCHHCVGCFYHKTTGIVWTLEMSPMLKWKHCKQATMMT